MKNGKIKNNLANSYRYHFLLHFIIFLWGFTGIIGKLLHQTSFIIVWYRLLFAISALLVYMVFRKVDFKIGWKDSWKVIGVGIVVTLHWLTFYYAIEISTASLAILCLSTTTLHVTWLEPLVLGSKFRFRQLFMSILVIFGIIFVAKDFKGDEVIAVVIGLISALCAALFSVFNAKLSQEIPSVQLSLYELLVGLIGLSFFLFFKGTSSIEFHLFPSDVFWLLFLGIVCTSFAFITTIEIVKRLGAFTVSLSINLEPVYTILLAIVLLGEHKLLNTSFYLGAIIIILVLVANGIISYLERTNKV